MQMTKNLQLLLFGFSIMMVAFIVYQRLPRVFNHLFIEDEAEPQDSVPSRVSGAKAIMTYDVILNSYMRSGSSIAGKILGFRNDTFYFYEPLFKSLHLRYFRGPYEKCHYLRLQCNVSGDLSQDLARLNSIFDCDYPKHVKAFGIALTANAGGPKWESYKMCRKRKNATDIECLESGIHHCREAKHRVSKVLRTTVDNLTPLLETRPNLKVIHLFRDPRGILNSHFRTKWHQLYHQQGNTEVIRNDVMSLCHRMMYDIKAAKQLKIKFPDRFRIIQYEDLVVDILMKTAHLFEFVGMSYTRADRNLVDLLTGNSMPRSRFGEVTKTTWRKSLSWDHVNLVDSICTDAYKELGYKAFSDMEAYMNPKIPSMEAQLPYAL